MSRQGRQDAYRALHTPAERQEPGRVSRVCQGSAQIGGEAATDRLTTGLRSWEC